MGLFKSIGNIVRKVTKPIKKVVKSPFGRAALLGAGIYGLGGGQFFGGRAFPGVQPGGFSWKRMIPNLIGSATTGGTHPIYDPGTIGNKGILGALKLTKGMGSLKPTALGVGTAAAAGSLALAPQLEEEVDVDVDSAIGDADYRRLAEYYEPEWEEWLLSQGYSADDAARLANERIFSSQGGRIGFFKGAEADTRGPAGGQAMSPGTSTTGGSRHGGRGEGNRGDGIIASIRNKAMPKVTRGRAERELMNRMGLANRGNLWGILGKKSPDLWARQTGNPHLDYTEEDINRVTEIQDYFDGGKGNFNITQDQYYDIFPKDKPPIDTGGGGEGQPYIWPPRNVGGVSSAVTENAGGDGDYYGYQEWADWEGQPTTPMFGGTKYRDVLSSRGGRIGLYAGGMCSMNQGMNTMTMNQVIGCMNVMGSPRSQMMGPQQDPRMAKMNQMQNINRGIQSVRPPQQSEDAELIQLIKLLTSMGIPMEQLRGRTKEELVELVVSVKGKMQGGRDVKETAEVIEEEDIREQNQAAGGGLMRSRYAIGAEVEGDENILIKIAKALFRLTPVGAGGLAAEQAIKMYQNLDPDTQQQVQTLGKRLSMITPPGMAVGLAEKAYDMYQDRAGDEVVEEEEIIEDMNQGGLTRTGYAMGTSQFGLMGNEHPIIPSKDGQQLDMRDRGGYQPHGKAEKHDDVRALLAQGEFVMTSDAVKGMGGGDREVGAKKMYDLMHNMEAMA